MNIMVVNAGSSSVKFTLYAWDSLEELAEGLVDFTRSDDAVHLTLFRGTTLLGQAELPQIDHHEAALKSLEMLRSSGVFTHDEEIVAVGHRLIVGGVRYRKPVLIDDEVKREVVRFTDLAPLHIPMGLGAMEATEDALPHAVQAGVFDTAFFGYLEPHLYLYPLPYRWYEQWGVRRYGYHGTSHAWAMERAAEMLGRPANELRLVTVHLGQGASASAIRDGKAVTNTMGFTALEGLMMGTRSGTVDPGVLIYVQRHCGLTADDLLHILYQESGLLGVSEISGDFRAVQRAAREGHERARIAWNMYAARTREAIGALAVTLGGVDAVVFTGSIAENARSLRAEICKGLECLGLHLAPERNVAAKPDAAISTDDSQAAILVVRSRENYVIARATKQLAAESVERE